SRCRAACAPPVRSGPPRRPPPAASSPGSRRRRRRSARAAAGPRRARVRARRPSTARPRRSGRAAATVRARRRGRTRTSPATRSPRDPPPMWHGRAAPAGRRPSRDRRGPPPGPHRLRRAGEAVAQEQPAARVRVTGRAPRAGEFAERHVSIVAPAPRWFIRSALDRAPTQESHVLYEIAKPVVMAVVRVLWNPTISGAEHIPEDGPVILASNHQAYSDTVFLPGQVRRSVNFLGKSDIFEGRSPVHRVAAAVMRGIRVMPVDRSGGTASRAAIEAGLAVLERGEVLG